MTRRMFSDDVTTTDVFLDMPQGSQLLYFHLGMNADDDGFIANPKMVMRAIRASDDDLRLLFLKKFLLSFDSGVCVVKHWRMNNYIRKQIYQETKYKREKALLYIRENGTYTFNPDNALPVPDGHFTVPTTQIENTEILTSTSRRRDVDVGKSKVSIGKERIGVVEKKPKTQKPETKLPEWLDKALWLEWEAYRREKGKKLTETTIKRQIALLEANRGQYRAIIEKSILNGWTGLFPIEKKDIRDTDKARAFDKMREEQEEAREREENAKNNENIAKVYRDLGALGEKMKG